MKKLLSTIFCLVSVLLICFSANGFSAAYRTIEPVDTTIAVLTPKQREDLVNSIQGKVKRLEQYIALIASKRLSGGPLDDMIKQAVELFNSENNFVQSSSKDKDGNVLIRKRPVYDYFVRLS